nr:immunoglobulin light chain junction region [Macaca mulatta]MOX20912.1 immunoglobulin light chain junction region [Macaca mulatta]MOX22164.1 immunoglobulin light chain junction region [Macaca mulatta]
DYYCHVWDSSKMFF